MALAATLLCGCPASAATTGKLQVTLGPSAAVTQGARWAVDGGTWRGSGVTVSNLTPGTHKVTFISVINWTAPATVDLAITANKTTTFSAAYSAAAASLSFTLDPSPAATEGARWNIDGGKWYGTGARVSGLTAGPHTIGFKPVAGWNTPVSRTVTLALGDKQTLEQIYSLALGSYVVLGYNDLGMHCMNQDFSEEMILPPYNTIYAQVIRRGREPQLLENGATLTYSIPGNTTSANKTNFWTYAPQLFGVNLAPNVGLTGHGLSGTMDKLAESKAWTRTGIPITQISDNGKDSALQIVDVRAKVNNVEVARTNFVMPVSWEISCNLCHNTPGITPDTDILRAHDRLHGTQLEASKPVACGSCHAQAPLGTTGTPGVKSLSAAMHGAHASRMGQIALANNCYACHPGVKTQCQRDIHLTKGVVCTNCHGDMAAVGSTSRRPWIDEPKCGDCHQRSGFKFEEPGKLFKESRGHHEVRCGVCHGSPHAITPTVTKQDNIQAQMMQGKSGVLDCKVCHITTPNDEFEHHL